MWIFWRYTGPGSGGGEAVIISNPSSLKSSSGLSKLSASTTGMRLTSDSGVGTVILGGTGSKLSGDDSSSVLKDSC